MIIYHEAGFISGVYDKTGKNPYYISAYFTAKRSVSLNRNKNRGGVDAKLGAVFAMRLIHIRQSLCLSLHVRMITQFQPEASRSSNHEQDAWPTIKLRLHQQS